MTHGDAGGTRTGGRTSERRRPSRLVGGRYRLERRLGAGGAGVVWRATDTSLGRPVAIKFLHPELTEDTTAVAKFRREAVAAASVTHPHVITVYDVTSDDAYTYLVMEYVEGPSLADVIDRDAPLDLPTVTTVGQQVAAGLGAAHAAGVVHRDVKPGNVLLTPQAGAKIVDFGIAQALGRTQAQLTSPGTVVGTAAYVSPERLRGATADARADVYSLGLVLHEALTGRRAFSGGSAAEIAEARLQHDPTPLRHVRPEVPDELAEVLAIATRRDPDQRFRDGRALARALAQVSGDGPSEQGGAPPVQHTATGGGGDDVPTGDATTTRALEVPEQPQRRGGGFALLGAAAALALLGITVVALGGDDGPGREPSGDGATPLPVATSADFDPFGDRGEHGDEVPAATDGDATTTWTTERYTTADLGGLKPGVGVWFDLGADTALTAVRVETPRPGMRLELYAADAAPGGAADLGHWGDPLASTDMDAPTAELTPPTDTSGRYWLVWITSLPPGDGGYRAAIGEVAFLAAAG